MKKLFILLLSLVLAACNGGDDSTDESNNSSSEESTTTSPSTPSNSPTSSPNSVKVLAFNDLGMHCMDKEYSTFSILPPFNVLNAQVVLPSSSGSPRLLDSNQVELRYSGVMDAKGSINTSSTNKTDFWQYANALFGKQLNAGQGLTGLYMPADNPQAPGEQLLSYNAQRAWFSAEGIPITPLDDTLRTNSYPLLRVGAYDKQTGKLLGYTDAVVPVAMETDCKNCHASGQMAASGSQLTWATDGDLEIQAKKNILLLHDKRHFTKLSSSTPVLCAQCHYSAPLDLNRQGPQKAQVYLSTLSQVMHTYHGQLKTLQGDALFSANKPVEETCYQCHPGKITQCHRDTMKTEGMNCYSCHGDIAAVGGLSPLLKDGSVDGGNDGKARRPWQDLPRCQSCHTGDAVNHLSGQGLVMAQDGFRLRQAYKTGDSSASPLLATNKRFAENSNTLFRNSKGHGNLACEACHGSTHAIWPVVNADANDNVAASQLQGHTGTLVECKACHLGDSLALTTNGPHGLHNVGDSRWTDENHANFYRRDPNGCKSCHGARLEGTSLSKVAVTRTLRAEGKNVTLQAGQLVSCNICHRTP